MIKKIFFALFFSSLITSNAQDTIRVKLEPNNGYKWIMLYKIKGAKQQYISNTESETNEFELVVPEGKKPGMYRLMYDTEHGGYYDFLYDNKPVSITFNPKLPEQTAQFETSENNKLFQSYLNSILDKQSKVDSVQMVYFNTKDAELSKLYTKRVESLNAIQDYFEKESEGKLANDFIKVNKKYNSPTLLETPTAYLETIESHFFDYVDFDNENLANSSIFVDKVIEYVFYINGSDDPEIHRTLKKKSIEEALSKIGENSIVKSEVLSSLLYTFAGQEKLQMVDFVKEKYKLLPEENKNPSFIADIDSMLKLAIGRVAPEITWKEGGKQKSLIDLEGAKNYLVVFWSTSCSHCLKEIPELYKLTKDNKDLKVIAVALEVDEFGFNYHTPTMDKWINILSINKNDPTKKWEAKLPRSYDIYATPTYFMLDKDKKIIAKPEQLKDLLVVLKSESKVEE